MTTKATEVVAYLKELREVYDRELVNPSDYRKLEHLILQLEDGELTVNDNNNTQ